MVLPLTVVMSGPDINSHHLRGGGVDIREQYMKISANHDGEFSISSRHKQ